MPRPSASEPRSLIVAALPWLLILVVLLAVAWPALSRAAFVPDDCRLLLQARAVSSGDLGTLATALTVENRWDGDWWIPDGTVVRFFRPLVVLSLALDRAIWGESPLGFVLGNLVLHFIASVLAFCCLRRLTLGQWPALVAALLFTTLACHAEQIFFAAGRTDTIPVIAMLWGLFVFLGQGETTRVRGALGLAAIYFVALVAKESTFWLPVAFVCIDRWRASPGANGVAALWRRRRPLYIACAGALVGYVLLRTWVLGDAGALPAPYVFTPSEPGFVGHVGLAAAHYAASLVAGLPVRPFLESADALGTQASASLWGGAAFVLGLLWWGWRTPLGRLCVVLFLLALLPQLPLYTSGRYLYPASLPWAALVGLLAARLARRRLGFGVLFAVAVIGVQGFGLRRELGQQPLYFDGVSMCEWTTRLFRTAPLARGPARPVYVIDLPLSWLDTQFLQQTLAVNWPEGDVTVRVLCRGPQRASQALAEVRKLDARSIELVRPKGRLQEPRASAEFPQRRVVVGERIRERDYEVEVLEVVGEHASKVRVHFDRDLDQLQLMRCHPVRGGWTLLPVL